MTVDRPTHISCTLDRFIEYLFWEYQKHDLAKIFHFDTQTNVKKGVLLKQDKVNNADSAFIFSIILLIGPNGQSGQGGHGGEMTNWSGVVCCGLVWSGMQR